MNESTNSQKESKRLNDRIVGGLQIAFANFFVGFNIICNKNLVNSVPIPILLELRYFFGMLIMLVMILISRIECKFYLSKQRYTMREKWIYLLMALSGGAVFNAIYMFGLHNTSAIVTGVISSTIPIMVVLLSFIFLREKITLNHSISALFVALGICILNVGHPSSQSHTFTAKQMQIGNFIVFIAMIPEAMFTIFAKMLTIKVSPIVSALYINAINLLFCTPFFLFSLQFYSLRQLSIFQIFLSFLIGLFSGALFYSFYNSGITKISAQTAGLLIGVVPISTTVLSLIFLGESLGFVSFIGMLFVLTSIYIGVRKTKAKVIQQ